MNQKGPVRCINFYFCIELTTFEQVVDILSVPTTNRTEEHVDALDCFFQHK